MHPAPSIIFFTTATGAGYGLLILLALGAAGGLIGESRWLGGAGLGLALGLITAGLIGSTRHLKHPERAWRAVSQWRSSWLSREGLAALLTYVPALAFAFGWTVFGSNDEGVWIAAGLVAALGAGVTLWCTGMIYGSLRPVRSWHRPLTPWLYLGFALAGGAWLLHLLLLIAGAEAAWAGWCALGTTLVAFGIELLWRRGGAGAAAGDRLDPGRATGLGLLGRVRMVEPPHTQTNYLLTEMGYQVGRKHARKLRLIALALAAATLLLTGLAMLAGGVSGAASALAAAATGLAATAIGRWLFFAEAVHAVTLYYGREAA